MTERVGSEFVGKARALRSKVAASYSDAEIVAATLLNPLRPKPGVELHPRHKYLRRVAQRWLREMPRCGQLATRAEFTADHQLSVAEIRCGPAAMRFPGWQIPEPSIAIYSFGVIFIAPELLEQRRHIASVGAHSLARYYQRAADPSDSALFAALAALVPAYTAAAADNEFIVEAGGGAWRGETTLVAGAGDLQRVLAIRTFH